MVVNLPVSPPLIVLVIDDNAIASALDVPVGHCGLGSLDNVQFHRVALKHNRSLKLRWIGIWHMQIRACDEWALKFDAKPRAETYGVANCLPDTFTGRFEYDFLLDLISVHVHSPRSN